MERRVIDALLQSIRTRLQEAHHETFLELRGSADFSQFNRREGVLTGIELAQKIMDDCYREMMK
jgi:hypothetical protein